MLDAVREAIRAEDEAVRAAKAADDVSRARFIRRLEAERLLRPADDRERKRRYTLPTWLPMVAGLGVIAFGVRIGVEVGRMAPDLPEVIETSRGVAGTITLTVAEPASTERAVMNELRALRLAPRRLSRADRIIIEVPVTAGRLEAFRAWAEPRGGEVSGPGTYRIFINSGDSAAP